MIAGNVPSTGVGRPREVFLHTSVSQYHCDTRSAREFSRRVDRIRRETRRLLPY